MELGDRMAVNSMTGFARTNGQYTVEPTTLQDDTLTVAKDIANQTTWSIELRSVNGKGLDIKVRMPNTLEAIEQKIKKQLSSKINRGNVSVNILVKNQETKGTLELNQVAFQDILKAAKTASELSKLPMPSLDALLNMRGVLKEQEAQEDETITKQLHNNILLSLDEVLDAFLIARGEEGAKLQTIITTRLNQIHELTERVTKIAQDQPDQLKQKIKENIALLNQTSQEFDQDRLHQEAMIIAVKADISEELDRLKAHVEQAHDLLGRDEPIGRRLDFLCQEFNREANTLCSKSHSKELTYIGLELKTIIDQLREQVQNIE